MLERLTQSVDQPWMVWAVCWFVSLILVVAAWIDGRKLKVPNWLTFPLILSGWAVSGYFFGWSGLYSSLLGTAVGLGLLLPAYAIGGMGAGDVKLLAGVGAWLGMAHTFWAFVVTVVVGAVLAWLWSQSAGPGVNTFVSFSPSCSRLWSCGIRRNSRPWPQNESQKCFSCHTESQLRLAQLCIFSSTACSSRCRSGAVKAVTEVLYEILQLVYLALS